MKAIAAYSPTDTINLKKLQLKTYAINTALTSDYAKRTYDVIPTWILSYIIRTFVDFALFYRLYTRNYLVNLMMSVVVSVVVTMSSPFFYDLVWQYKDNIQKFTDHVVRNMSWDYFYTWKNRIALTTASVLIFILYMDWIVVTNWWIIECILHTVVCGFILGKYDEVKEYISKPRPIEYRVENVHSGPHFAQPVHLPLRQARLANANIENCFMRHARPTMRAKKVFVQKSGLFSGMQVSGTSSQKIQRK